MAPREKLSGIYVIENMLTGDFYIGSSNSIAHRRASHLCHLRKGRHANRRLQRACNRDGVDALHFEAICLVPPEELQAAETRLLARLVGHPKCYNFQLDATATNRGRRFSDEQLVNVRAARQRPEYREKVAASLRGRKLPPEHAAKLRAAVAGVWNGRKHTPATREKMSRTRRSTPRSEAQQRALRELQSRPVSEATRAKQSASHKGRMLGPQSAERREQASQRQRGKPIPWLHSAEAHAKAAATRRAQGWPVSPETRAKMSESAKRRCERQRLQREAAARNGTQT